MMSAIATRAERAWASGEVAWLPPLPENHEPGATVARAARKMAETLNARAVITHTSGGVTTRWVCCHRSAIPVLALCTNERMQRRLSLVWGVESERVEPIQGTAHMVDLALNAAVRGVGAQPGDTVVIVGGTPYQVSGRTNLIKVETVPGSFVPG